MRRRSTPAPHERRPNLSSRSASADGGAPRRPLVSQPRFWILVGLLFALNTPDNRLEVFRPSSTGLEHINSITVGLEPVAVAARSDREVWVVNHLSDSVSVVEISNDGRSGGVTRTLLVGDEPRDIVLRGPDEDGRSSRRPTAARTPGAIRS